jgi:1-acyl-sn-glycerol-3-phosphate acyltransferase
VVFLFPRWNERRRRVAVRRWSRRLLAIVRVRLRCQGLPRTLPERCLVVLNHVSWLDIFLLDAVHPAVFVAKTEIARWPLFGIIARGIGTVFIERGSRRSAQRTNRHIAETLASGSPVACFPEGTTTYGDSVGRFHGALFQPAIDSDATVLPVALRYLDGDGRLSVAGAYVGEDSLLRSVWTLLAERSLVAELRFLPPRRANGSDRRWFAQRLRSDIARALGVPAGHLK